MEPDELLEQLREQADDLSEHDDELVVEFARLFQKLDKHVSGGGTLPDEWDDAEEDEDDDDDEEDEEEDEVA